MGEVVNLRRGYDLPKRLREEGPYPVISSAGPTGTHSEYKVEPPGVATGRYGTLGRVHFVETPMWPLNTTLYVDDFKGNVPRYVAYMLESLNLEQGVASAAVPGINRNHVHLLPVCIPDVATQERIASALATLDKLIDNSRRRGEALEEIARLMYREWFVDFRFPDHQGVRFVDSEFGLIPRNWKSEELGDVLEMAYGKALRANDRRGGSIAVYGSGGRVGWHDVALVGGPGIVVGRKGNFGAVHWCDDDFYPIDTTYYVKSNLPPRFLHQMLRTVTFVDAHAAVPGLSRDQAYKLRFLRPPDDLTARYEVTVLPIYDLCRILTLKCRVLQEMRNLLLPRLVSGELDISDLDLGLEAVGV